MTFLDKLQNKWQEKKFVCIGLDPVKEKLPLKITNFFEFNRQIIDTTHDLVAAYKPNSAFYEGQGTEGIEQLKKTTEYISQNFPDIVIILDAKRGDIGNTNDGYVKFAFDYLKADAITLHPYMGKESLEPFLKRSDKGLLVLCKTSNPGAGEFQDLEFENKKLFEVVAQKVSKEWNSNKNCGLVVGATYPEELEKVRFINNEIPILIPGIGAQGGDVEATVRAAKKNFLIASSRGIIFASSSSEFAIVARGEADKLHEEIKKYL